MPGFIGDHFAETMQLNSLQHAASFLLLMAAWRHDTVFRS